MNTIKVDLRGFEKLAEQLEQAQDQQDTFYQDTIKELAARLLTKVIKRTPVGVPPTDIPESIYKEYWSGYAGGTLRRGWTAKTEAEAISGSGQGTSIPAFLDGAEVLHVGSEYYIVLLNPVRYASFVEYGHRQKPGRYVPAIGKRLKNSFVEGQYMLTLSEKELQSQAPKIIQNKLEAFLREVFDAE